MQRQTGHYPALFGQDFGFSEPGTWFWRERDAYQTLYDSESTVSLEDLPESNRPAQDNYPVLK